MLTKLGEPCGESTVAKARVRAITATRAARTPRGRRRSLTRGVVKSRVTLKLRPS